MNHKHKVITSSVLLCLSLLTGCAFEESVEVESILEEKGVFSFEANGLELIIFTQEGMKILNSDSLVRYLGDYPFPFEPDTLYEDYEITYTEDLLQIEADGATYDLTVLGPRFFKDKENDLELQTKEYLLDESDESE